MERIRLGKGGLLKGDRYNEATKTWEKDIDVTQAFFFALSSYCDFEKGISLRDVFELVNRINLYPLLSPMLTGGMWLEDIVKEGLSSPAQTDKYLDFAVVGWNSAIHETKDGINDWELKSDFHGRKEAKQDRYALDLTPSPKMIDMELRLDPIVEIRDETKLGFEAAKQTGQFPIILKCQRQHTLYDILIGIFWELSFHGGPKERDARYSDLMKQMERIDSGEEKTISMEELKAKLAAKRCQKCNGEGWVWWNELDNYYGPANDPHDCQSDDTKYTCDECNGTGTNKEGK